MLVTDPERRGGDTFILKSLLQTHRKFIHSPGLCSHIKQPSDRNVCWCHAPKQEDQRNFKWNELNGLKWTSGSKWVHIYWRNNEMKNKVEPQILISIYDFSGFLDMDGTWHSHRPVLAPSWRGNKVIKHFLWLVDKWYFIVVCLVFWFVMWHFYCMFGVLVCYVTLFW